MKTLKTLRSNVANWTLQTLSALWPSRALSSGRALRSYDLTNVVPIGKIPDVKVAVKVYDVSIVLYVASGRKRS